MKRCCSDLCKCQPPKPKELKKIILLSRVMLFKAIKKVNDLVEEVADSITNMTRSLTLPNEPCLGPKRSGTLLSLILHSLIWRSSAPETIKGIEGWNEAQFTPRSWPSRTCLTTQSAWPKRSVDPGVFMWSSRPAGPGATFFFLNPEKGGKWILLHYWFSRKLYKMTIFAGNWSWKLSQLLLDRFWFNFFSPFGIFIWDSFISDFLMWL